MMAQVEGNSGNLGSVVSGSLASSKPPGGGEPEERGDEEDFARSIRQRTTRLAFLSFMRR